MSRLIFDLSSFQVQDLSFSAVAVAIAAKKIKRGTRIFIICRMAESRHLMQYLSVVMLNARKERRLGTHNIRSRLNESESESRLYICIVGW